MYRLISQADDQGRLQGSAKRVRATCFGMRSEITERKVAAAITELAEAGFVIRYEIDGRAFLQIEHWTDLQGRSGRRAYPSRHPAPPGWTGDWVSVKPEEIAEEHFENAPDAQELRAVGAQDARDLNAPIPVTVPFSTSIPSSGLSSPTRGSRGWNSAGDVLREPMTGAPPSETHSQTAMAIPRRASR
jgi:hypothetical protein